MTDQSQRDPSEGSEPAGDAPAALNPETSSGTAPAAEPPAWTPEPSGPSGPAALAADRPEAAVGAAFAGGLVFALILKRLAR